MNVFDIIGPVMIGPSSSHTAGAARIAGVVYKLMGEPIVSCTITFHGSFADTYRGHGTDKAVIGGLLGMEVDDTRISDSLDIAVRQGLSYVFDTEDLGNVHPNTVLINANGFSGRKITLTGSSVGGGNIIITQINGVGMEFTGQYYTLVIEHTDVPGIVASVTGCLAEKRINIAYMRLYRSSKGGEAYMVIEADQTINAALILNIKQLRFVRNAVFIEPM